MFTLLEMRNNGFDRTLLLETLSEAILKFATVWHLPINSNVHAHLCLFQLFAFMGFIASVIWIYSTANEIVNLLRVSFFWVWLVKVKQFQQRHNNPILTTMRSRGII